MTRARGGILESDPIGLAGGPNQYVYASADPINHFDRTGLVEDTVTASCKAGHPSACAALAGDDSAAASRAADLNKLNHIFNNPEHGLDCLLSQFKSPEAALKAIEEATQAAAEEQGLQGVFQTIIKVGNETITVRGKVIDGIARIGTAFK